MNPPVPGRWNSGFVANERERVTTECVLVAEARGMAAAVANERVANGGVLVAEARLMAAAVANDRVANGGVSVAEATSRQSHLRRKNCVVRSRCNQNRADMRSRNTRNRALHRRSHHH